MSNTRKLVTYVNFAIILINILGQGIPMAFPLALPMQVSPNTKEFYDYVNAAAAKPGAVAFLDLSYSIGLHTTTMFEIVQYISGQGIRWVAYSGSSAVEATIIDMINNDMPNWAPTFVYGVDYAYYGFIPGQLDIRMNLLANNQDGIPTDYLGTPRSQLPLLASVHDRFDFDIFINCMDGFSEWAKWWPSRPDAPSMVLIRSDSWPDFLTYYPATFAAGMNAPTACAEWEAITGIAGVAVSYSDGLTIVLYWTVFIIIAENVVKYLKIGQKVEAE
ncbi:MAG: hypothetical protein ACXACF_00275 [Candidatus Hermodarchaeia archaeon]|jgi:hypothetical protein